VQPEAESPYPGNGHDTQETLITTMEITETIDEEARIAALENRVRYLDALVKGLVAELMDLKTVAMGMSRQDGERSRQERRQATVVRGTTPPAPGDPSDAVSSDGSVVVRPKGESRQDAPAEPAMARIMQADGTMKMEPRYGDKKTVDTSSGSGRIPKGRSAGSRKNP
jgi:hypothetical protein